MPVSRRTRTAVLCPRRSERTLSTQTHVDSTHVPHLVNGLSLEIGRQADRIRRRSHTRDWPGAASAMTELEQAVDLLGQLVNASLRASLMNEPGDDGQLDGPEPVELSIGQYL